MGFWGPHRGKTRRFAQIRADLSALIPAGADHAALLADEGALYDGAPLAPARLVPLLAALLEQGFEAGGAAPEDGLIWHFHGRAIRDLAPGPRAILCTALMIRLEQGLASREEVGVAEADCISAPREALEAALLPVARSLTPEDIAAIARGWDASRVAQEARAITEAVAAGRFRGRQTGGWPEAGMDSMMGASDNPASPGWLPCTAWILLSVFAFGDARGDAELMWRRNRGAFLSLPPLRRAPILAAFRGVMERESADGHGAPGFDAARVIPYDGPLF